MPTTSQLQAMFETARTVLHEQLGSELGSQIGHEYLREHVHVEGDVIAYFNGKTVSDLLEDRRVAQKITEAGVTNAAQREFVQVLWHTLLNTIGAHRFIVAAGMYPQEFNPLQVVTVDGLNDIQFAITETVRAYQAIAL